MELIRGLHNIRPQHHGCVATIGVFDGVHLGHQVVLEQVKTKARELGLPSAVMVFEPMPIEYFSHDKAPPRLMRFREKSRILAQHGIDRLVCLQFNKALRSLSASEFIKQVLVDGLGVRFLVVGDDTRFGHNREGDYAMLQAAGEQFDFTVADTQTYEIDGERVSSTRIREALGAGAFDAAARLLGRPYCVRGRVGYGQQLGRQLGVPTANVRFFRNRAPFNGVYAVTAEFDGQIYPAVANVGKRPTVGGTVAVLEVHLLNFSGDLYGKTLTVEFKRKLRDEKKFGSLDELKANIGRDIETAKDFFGV